MLIGYKFFECKNAPKKVLDYISDKFGKNDFDIMDELKNNNNEDLTVFFLGVAVINILKYFSDSINTKMTDSNGKSIWNYAVESKNTEVIDYLCQKQK